MNNIPRFFVLFFITYTAGPRTARDFTDYTYSILLLRNTLLAISFVSTITINYCINFFFYEKRTLYDVRLATRYFIFLGRTCI